MSNTQFARRNQYIHIKICAVEDIAILVANC